MLEFARTLSSEAALARILDASADFRFNPCILEQVLELRTRYAGDGNRRRLFAAFDDLMVADLPPWVVPAERPVPGRVQLRRLTLRNWKVFASADLHFPKHDNDRPVVLIGGKNGYGKTSLLQALLFGLFGAGASESLQRGTLVPQAPRGGAYRAFMERALHQPALERGDGFASVKSEWDTPDGPVAVERRWYFDDQGRFTPEDETVTLWLGSDLNLIDPPSDVDRTVFVQQEVERRLLPPSLAAFVFFDGEQVKRLAEGRFADQVRVAAEAVMGLAAWREAAADLKAYARDRSRGVSRDDAELQGIANELLVLEAEDAELADRLDQAEARRKGPKSERDGLLTRLAGLQTGTYANLHELLEQRQSHGLDLGRARHEFASAISAAAPLAFIPTSLRERLVDRLRMEVEQTQQWRELFADQQARAAFLAALQSEADSPDGASPLIEPAARAWDSLSAPSASQIPSRHDYLGSVRQRLVQVALAGADAPALLAAARRLQQLQSDMDGVTAALEHFRLRPVHILRPRSISRTRAG